VCGCLRHWLRLLRQEVHLRHGLLCGWQDGLRQLRDLHSEEVNSFNAATAGALLRPFFIVHIPELFGIGCCAAGP
jgi:hypothetical protein